MVKVVTAGMAQVKHDSKEVNLSIESLDRIGLTREELKLGIAVDDALSRLADVQQLVLGMRFGLSGAALSKREVAGAIDATQDHVEEIEVEALRSLYRPSKN